MSYFLYKWGRICDNARMSMNEIHERDTSHESASQVSLPVDSDEEESAKATQPLLGIGLAVLLATATFFSGLHIGNDTKLEANLFSFFSRDTRSDDSVNLSEFWRLWNLIE